MEGTFTKAIDILYLAKQQDIDIILNGEQLQLKIPEDKTIEPALLQEIRNNKELLIDYLRNDNWRSASVNSGNNKITPFNRALIKAIPLSFSQERLWFIDRLEGSTQYHLPAILRLKGEVNKEALEKALKQVVNRHEVLRTIYKDDEQGIGYQEIIPAAGWKLTETDKTAESKENTGRYIEGLVKAPFDLSADYMLRGDLVKTNRDEQVLVVTMHHIASDGWSVSVLVKEVVELYGAQAEGRQAELPELKVQYADYALWQREYLKGELLETKLSYWKEKLNGTATLQMPADYSRPVRPGTAGAIETFQLTAELTKALKALGQKHGATLYMTLLAAFNALLYRYSNQEDICVGTPVAGRQQQETEGLIGFFINTLALRTRVNGNEPFTKLLNSTKQTTLEAYSHQEVPFEKVVDAVVKERDMTRSPLFQVLFSLQNTPEVPELKIGGLTLAAESGEHNTSKFDLSFLMKETGNTIQGAVEYSTDLYKPDTIARMMGHYLNLLTGITITPEEETAKLNMLSKAEEAQILKTFNDTKADYPNEKGITQLFEEQAAKTPDQTAVIFEAEQLTYQELNEKSNQVARYLIKQGIQKETLVPICVERGINMLTGILGILKAGGAYVPVDPNYPQERIAYMLEDTKASIIVTTTNSKGKLSQTNNKQTIIDLDADKEQLNKEDNSNLNTSITPNQLAYVIYTSGSTGKPKGVMVEQHSIVNYLCNSKAGYIDKNSDNKAGSFIHLSYTFDASLTAMFMPLITGKYVVIGSNELLDVFTDSNLEKYAPYDFIKITPSHIGLLPVNPNHKSSNTKANNNWLTKKLVLGGEALRMSQFETIIKEDIAVVVINEYGPTEATVGCTAYSFNTKDTAGIKQNEIPIGKPISGTSLYILNTGKKPNPIGVTGELYIGGNQVARGYLNQEQLTEEKFIQSPFNQNERLYKTGDLGRWLPDGTIEYAGRTDDQVKIRGYRVELGEIESLLTGHATISGGVVLAREDKQGTKRLVGYIVPGKTNPFDKQLIQDYLRTKLPEYMVPGLWVVLENLPLTSNGKVDKKALPDPEVTDSKAEYVAPRNETEEKLVQIWQELLGVEKIGIYDNFFELGGHSLLAMRVVSAIRRELNTEISVRDLFVNPDIAGLGKQLSEQSTVSLLPAIEVGKRPEHIPLSFSQERLWFIDKLEGSTQYHIPAVLRLKGELNREALFDALHNVIRRHEVLRTIYLEDASGIGYQQVMPATDWTLTYIDHTGSTDNAMLEWQIKQMVKAPFNLSGDYMLRADLIKKDETDHILVVTMHHIASDGWSVSVLVKEVVEIYESYIEGRSTYLKLLPVQYADYAIWQRNYMQGEILAEKIGYWKSKLQGVLPLELPTDYVRPVTIDTAGGNISINIDKGLSKQLLMVGKQHGSTLFMTLLAAFKVLLYRYSGQDDICVGTPIAGRQQQEIEGLVGFFINTLALRSRVDSSQPFTTLLEAVKQTTLEAYGNQEVPFEKVVDAVVKDRDMSRSPLFQVLFSLQNTPDVPELKLGNISLTAEEHTHNTTKFDIAFMLRETPGGIQGTVEYATSLYTEETIGRMVSHYETLLRAIVENPLTETGRLTLLDEAEETTLLREFNYTKAEYPEERHIISLFEAQAAKTPKATAVLFEEEQLSYKELNERSNQIARYLQKQGVKAETLVPICAERGINMLAGILGILKAGGAYVPIDPEYPSERIAYMLEDTAATIIVSTKNSRGKLTGTAKVIELDTEQEQISKESKDNLNANITPDQLAYVIYTSGSTGKPKGVMIEHRSATAFMAWCRDEFAKSKYNIVYATTSMCFDLSVFEMFYPLSTGKPTRILENGLAIADHLAKDTGVMINTVPSVVEHLLNEKTDLNHITVINMAGEPIPLRVSEALDTKNIEIRNLYGPTEDTTYSTVYRLEHGKPVTIGKPISNTGIYILNADKGLSPINVTGEICIGGAGLARGYLNKPELTEEKFIQNPFSEDKNARLYKTGDIGRWLPDGNIEYLGRIDDQVKIRGFRIELGEIDNVLNEHQSISQGIVIAKADQRGTKRLVGYVVTTPGNPFDKQAAQDYLRVKLPEYMVPGIWVELESLPLTPNGKVDKRALPDPGITENKAEYVAPRNETEQALAQIWQELLGIKQVGIYDNFFELGGHSLLAMRIVSTIKRKINDDITVKDLFVYPTIAGLSGYFKNADKKAQQSLIPIKASGNKAPLYIVCGAGGTVFTFREFASLLDPDQPVYGLQQPTEIGELEGLPNTIEIIAGKYIKEILAKNPDGPYALSGHCTGGIVAFEMARQLEAMNKKVAMLAMLDTFVSEKNKIEPGTFNNFYHLPSFVRKVFSSILAKVKFEIFLIRRYPKQALLYKARKARLIMGNNEPKPENIDMDLFNKISGMIQSASANYEIKPYEGDMLVFYAKEHYYFMDKMNKVVYKELFYSSDTLNAWSKYAQSVETYEVEGEHSAIFDPEHAIKLADILQRHLNESL